MLANEASPHAAINTTSDVVANGVDSNTRSSALDVPVELLDEVLRWRRVSCDSCGQSSMFCCPFCCTCLGAPDGVTLPQVKLPFRRCEVIFDDSPKKATSIHAKVLAPAQVRIVDLFTNDASTNRTLSRRGGGVEGDQSTAVIRDIPEYDPRTTLVLFPDDSSITFQQAAEENEEHFLEGATLIVIDAPWRRAQTLRRHPRLAHLRSVRLGKPPPSRFWRYHSEGAGCVSTIEALAACVQEVRGLIHTSELGDPKDEGERFLQEPLLFYFVRQFAYIVAARQQAGHSEKCRAQGLPMEASAKEQRSARVRQKERSKRLRPMGSGDVSSQADEIVGSETSGERPKRTAIGHTSDC